MIFRKIELAKMINFSQSENRKNRPSPVSGTGGKEKRDMICRHANIEKINGSISVHEEEQGTSPEGSTSSGHNANIEIIVVQCQAG